jgi:hypothetical protein
MEQGVGLVSALAEFNIDTERRHQELLELLSTQSSSYDNLSSVRMVTADCAGPVLTTLLRLDTVL